MPRSFERVNFKGTVPGQTERSWRLKVDGQISNWAVLWTSNERSLQKPALKGQNGTVRELKENGLRVTNGQFHSSELKRPKLTLK